MLKISKKTLVCAVCGSSSAYEVVTEKAAPSGAPDLDLRPAGEERGLLGYWAMECPVCGYCRGSVEEPFGADAEYFSSDEYKSLGGLPSGNAVASRLIKRGLAAARERAYKEAVRAFLAAAWAYDDDENDEAARACRLKAVDVMDSHPAAFKGDHNFRILLADMLRRSGEFARVSSEYEGKTFPSLLTTAVIFFETYLAAARDPRAHRIDEVPGVSAAKPGGRDE